MTGSGCERREGEDDWAFRQRIFVWMWPTDRGEAYEFLLGTHRSQWGLADTMLFMTIWREEQTEESLLRFISGFRGDPSAAAVRLAAHSFMPGPCLEGGEEQY